MRVQLQVSGPAIDLDSCVAAIPLVLQRLNGLDWVDGQAVVEGVVSDRLRVVDGIPGRAGATYRYAPAPDTAPPTTFTVTCADAERLAVSTEVALEDAPALAAVVTLTDPDEPRTLDVAGTLKVPPVPRFLGQRADVDLSVELRGLASAPQPQVQVHLVHRLLKADGVAHLARTFAGWQVDVDARLSLRGLAVLATPVLLIMRRRLVAAAQAELQEALAELATDLGGEIWGTPQEIADQVWAGLVVELTGGVNPEGETSGPST